ncbi:carbon monoxide dehydrogenase subunit G [uncultured Phycicoccus sp.]|uniref:SRPBCC family protein n=1 Tax=uncultured Phycicoccus sp. TaxID=661422 RepID=UPI002630D7CF|nr:carbon monoxide dehydrogenase subunit G [uncultured Phycicoccus sp.]
MKLTGTSTLEATPAQVWSAILDPAILARCIPGCEALTTVGEDRYAMTVTAGVAAIKGTYTGEVALTDMDEPSSLTLRASGSGAPGTIDADVRVRLEPSASGGTDLAYDADATVGGTIGGVGQRMLAGVTRKMATQFFTALDDDIAGRRVPVAPVPGVPVPAGTPAVGETFTGRAAAAPAASTRDLVVAALAGGLLALAGVALGARIARRR